MLGVGLWVLQRTRNGNILTEDARAAFLDDLPDEVSSCRWSLVLFR
jgi:hypothetical protein